MQRKYAIVTICVADGTGCAGLGEILSSKPVADRLTLLAHGLIRKIGFREAVLRANEVSWIASCGVATKFIRPQVQRAFLRLYHQPSALDQQTRLLIVVSVGPKLVAKAPRNEGDLPRPS